MWRSASRSERFGLKHYKKLQKLRKISQNLNSLFHRKGRKLIENQFVSPQAVIEQG